jgi:hypothetical protein
LRWVWNGVHSGLVRINEEILERRVAASVQETEINERRGSAELTTRHPLSTKVELNFVDKCRSLRLHVSPHLLQPPRWQTEGEGYPLDLLSEGLYQHLRLPF